jgi:CRP/FNR family nitrogen fixation transcriptional regulator
MLEQATIGERNTKAAHALRSAPMDAIPSQGTVLRLDRHRAVFRAGDDAERFFEVESGSVMVYRILDDGRRQLVEVVFPGGICGLASSDEYESDCETLMPTVLRSYRLSDLARSDALRARVIGQLQRQVSALHDHTVSLGRKTAEERVCSLILRLHGVENAARQERREVELPMTRTEIADYLGLTLETVCRTLTALARRKLLEIGSNKTEIKVPNLERLRHAACADAC